MDSAEIRDSFFSFFEERGHTRVSSSSLIPNDPTLLFSNAGMNQFKPYFVGEQTPPWPRAVSVQKCLRVGGKHNDLEEVGRTSRHLTFFEMLGNFSFGDYFKERAAPYAWELATEAWALDAERLWVSVYETDDEAFEIWVDEVGVPPERVVRLGRKDNYWDMGVAGPCGPCSEILYDRGDAYGEASPRGPADNEERYVEAWNLVFMQNECSAALDPIAELPKKNIDTGAGLERVAMLLQNKATIFDTDILGALVERAASLTGETYGEAARVDFGLRVLADHARSVAFTIADGVLPSNEERGYVLRRVMRRAVRHARLIGFEGEVLAPMADRCIELMGDAYPELSGKQDLILEVTSHEEERFSGTLKQGTVMLESAISEATGAGATQLPGEVAFKLHDTYGFPIDLTTEIAEESGLGVDTDEFDRLMGEQRERARRARAATEEMASSEVLTDLHRRRGATDFLGFEHLSTTAEVLAIAEGLESRPAAREGEEADLVLDRTVFYAEGGGQVGDRGLIRGSGGVAEVLDTQRLAPGLVGHRVKVTEGELAVGNEVTATVDPAWRGGAERAHTATHILHWALRDHLGEHATQAGSLVEPGRLRFDFSHYDALAKSQLDDLSDELQQRVLDDALVRAYETSFDFAKSIGAMAIFGEKYGDFVRVVEVGEYSKELCGGTHVPHTSNIGVIVLTGESSVGANLRRVEALVGRDGVDYLARRAQELEDTAGLLRAAPDQVAERVEKLLATQKDMERRFNAIERQAAAADAVSLIEQAEAVDDTRLVVARRDINVDALRALAQTLKQRLGSGIVVLGTAGEDRANLVVAITKDLTRRGMTAGDLIARGASVLGGGGGGKPELAISGGRNAGAIDDAIGAVARAARDAIRQ
jgi:alanyl-tRNA synthetase